MKKGKNDQSAHRTETDLSQTADGFLRKDRRSGRSQIPKTSNSKDLGQVNFNDKGNAVWEWRVDVPRRRDEDATIDLLECLDTSELSIDEEKDEEKSSEFNPYDTGKS